jgi:flagella basal body P-ring formation protein FlgA
MPVVHRGQTVAALVNQGALNITMKVVVLEDGAPGQIVRARNQQSLRDIRGKVLNDQTILVSL